MSENKVTLERATLPLTFSGPMQWATVVSSGRTKLSLGYDGAAKMDPDMTPEEALIVVKHLAKGWPEMVRFMRERLREDEDKK